MEGPGSYVGKRELPIFVGGRLLVWKLILTREADPGSSDGGSILIDNCSADASRQSPIRQLRTARCFCCRCSNQAAIHSPEDEGQRRLGQNWKAIEQDTQD